VLAWNAEIEERSAAAKRVNGGAETDPVEAAAAAPPPPVGELCGDPEAARSRSRGRDDR
jgi:hypothetical protein